MAIRSLKTGQFSRSTLVGNPVIMPGSYESIATVTVGSGGASSVVFSSIPSTYTHLQLRVFARSTLSGNADGFKTNFNSDTGSNYAFHGLYGDGPSSVGSFGFASQTKIEGPDIPGASATSGIFGATIIDILDYANTNKYKTIRYLNGYDANGFGTTRLVSGLWISTNAISSISIASKTTSTNIAQYSHFALYGVN